MFTYSARPLDTTLFLQESPRPDSMSGRHSFLRIFNLRSHYPSNSASPPSSPPINAAAYTFSASQLRKSPRSWLKL